MTDVVDKATRSRMMSGIRGKNTKPEMAVRSALHAAGYRFRLHREDLPGKPDLVLPKYHAAIFVNGCFWHGHECSLFRWPKSSESFWREKISANVDRDQRNYLRLMESGWRVCVIWECAMRVSPEMWRDSKLPSLLNWVSSDEGFTEIEASI